MKWELEEESKLGGASILARGAKFRQESPITSPGYRARLEALPRAMPPAWLVSGGWLSMALCVALLAVVLVMPLEEVVTVTGEVWSEQTTLVFSKVSGIVEKVRVVSGEYVEAGQELAALDSLEAQRDLARVEAALEEARSELARAYPVRERDYSAGVLVQKQQQGWVADPSLRSAQEPESDEAMQLFVKALKARVAALEAEEAIQKEILSRATLRAPQGGFVVGVASLEPGQVVQAGQPLFQILHGTADLLRLKTTEDRIDRIEPGQLVRFRANNNPDRLQPMGTARVKTVFRELGAENTRGETGGEGLQGPSFRILARIEKKPSALALGTTVQAEVVLGQSPFWKRFLMGSRKNPSR